MKKRIVALLIVMLIVLSGCSFTVETDALYIPEGKVETIEFKKENKNEDGTSYYCQKTVTDQEDVEACCEAFRKLSIKKAEFNEPHPITEQPLVITLRGAKDHCLILTSQMAYYDEIAYVYQEDDVYESVIALYSKLSYKEVKIK